jgi:hypothetical protein
MTCCGSFHNHILTEIASKVKPVEGVDLSTTVHQPGSSTRYSVEFVVPFATLAAYERYDISRQELINRSIVLINGERVTLDLQKAEAEYTASAR